jgi:uncharacterized membrane protein
MEFALITFDGVNAAEQVYARGRDAGSGHWQDQVGLVEHHEDGHLVLRGAFAGHYVDVDEAAHTSEMGAAEGLRTGALIGFLLGPPGFAIGSVLGAMVGSQEGEPGERDREPTLLADRLRAAVPARGSALVLVAAEDVVDEMLSACGRGEAGVMRRNLSAEDLVVIDAALSEAPTRSGASPREGGAG